jgi:hypothetical protein
MSVYFRDSVQGRGKPQKGTFFGNGPTTLLGQFKWESLGIVLPRDQ